MILTCPSCSARFTINSDLIGAAGRKVRCGGCGHTWRQLPTSENDAQPPPQGPSPGPIEMTIDPIEVEQESEARRLRRRSTAALRAGPPGRARGGFGHLIGWGALAAVVLLLAGGLWFGRGVIVAAVPEASRFYDLFGGAGEPAGQGLAIQNVKTVQRTFDSEKRLLIEGVVANISESDRPVPMLRASLHDDNGAELTAWVFSADLTRLSPGQTASFSTLAQSPPEGATELTIDFVADSLEAGAQ